MFASDCKLDSWEFYETQDASLLRECIAAGQDFATPAFMEETALSIALMVGTDLQFVQILWDEAAGRNVLNRLYPDGTSLLHRLAANDDPAITARFGNLLLDLGLDPTTPFGLILGENIGTVDASIPMLMMKQIRHPDIAFANRLVTTYISSPRFDKLSAQVNRILLDGASNADVDWLFAFDLLFTAGADVNHANESGWTPLLRLCNSGRLDDSDNLLFLNILLQYGANPNTKNLDGDTALHRIAQRGNTVAAKRLVEAGANPLALNLAGKSVLHQLASNGGSPEMLEFFISQGVDPSLKDMQGDTALSLQLQKKDGDRLKDIKLIEILEQITSKQ